MHELGHTRSALRADYLLHTPDAFVRTPLPGLHNGVAVVHIAPRLGAQFAMTTVEFAFDGTLAPGPGQRFLYVLSGTVSVHGDAHAPRTLSADSFCYLPEGSAYTVQAREPARALLFEKSYRHLPDLQPSPALFGEEDQVASTPLQGDPDLQVRCLLPPDPAFDFAVNTMTYAPGAGLSQVEVHYMEHGLLMLQGAGRYRLGEDWYAVQTGDAIWMAPFCPQWFAALGRTPAKYIIYKDVHRHVLA